MPYRSWMFFVVIGLAFSATLLEAQEQAQSPDGGENIQQQSSQTLPIPIPVQIIEDDESAEAREAREQQASNREQDDLIAQNRMADAADAMNEATQSMKNAAWWTFGAVTLGTALLVWTLLLTRQANAAAREAVTVTREIGRTQTRAYCGIDTITAVPVSHTEFKAGKLLHAEVIIKNFGQTPGHKCSGRASLVTYSQSQGMLRKIDRMPIRSIAPLNPGANFTFWVLLSIPNDSNPPDERIVITGYWKYFDCFGCRRTSHFRYYFEVEVGNFIPAKKGNYST